MCEYYLRFDPAEIEGERRTKIEELLNSNPLFSKDQFNELIKGFEEFYDFDTYKDTHSDYFYEKEMDKLL